MPVVLFNSAMAFAQTPCCAGCCAVANARLLINIKNIPYRMKRSNYERPLYFEGSSSKKKPAKNKNGEKQCNRVSCHSCSINEAIT